jgi:hypothetical protein
MYPCIYSSALSLDMKKLHFSNSAIPTLRIAARTAKIIF